MLPTLALIVGVSIVYFLVRKVIQYRSLRDFGGPWSAGWSRLWLLWANGSGKMNIVFTEVNDQYGERDDNSSWQCMC